VGALGGVLNVLYKSIMISTDALSKACLALVFGDGKPLEGEGVESEGRVVRYTRLSSMGGL
jgi:hypothetical protein